MSEEITLRAENIVKSFYGNRVLNGVVVDYINVLFMHFAIFNFADICVGIGGIGFCILCVFSEIKDTKKRKSAKSKAKNASDGENNA